MALSQKLSSISRLLFLLLVIFSFSSPVFAETGRNAVRDAKAPKEGKTSAPPTTGVLSRTMTGGGNQDSKDLPLGFDLSNLKAKSQAPITGSVYQVGESEWRVVLNNNAKDSQTVSVKMVQMGANSKTLKTDYWTTSVAGGATRDRVFPRVAGAAGAELSLEGKRSGSSTNR